jgi:hypothetical protein
MNGRYRIGLKEGQEPDDHPMVQKLLRMIDPGAKVTIRVWNEPLAFHTTGEAWRSREHPRYCEIRATGGKPCKTSAPKVAKPKPLAVEVVRKRLVDARETLESVRKRFGANIKSQWMEDPAPHREWLEARARERTKHREIGRAVGRILARHRVHAFSTASSRFGYTAEDYADLDAACGRKVERLSKVSEGQRERANGYLGWVLKQYAGSWYRFGRERKQETLPALDKSPNTVQDFLLAKADVEMLETMVQLVTRGLT